MVILCQWRVPFGNRSTIGRLPPYHRWTAGDRLEQPAGEEATQLRTLAVYRLVAKMLHASQLQERQNAPLDAAALGPYRLGTYLSPTTSGRCSMTLSLRSNPHSSPAALSSRTAHSCTTITPYCAPTWCYQLQERMHQGLRRAGGTNVAFVICTPVSDCAAAGVAPGIRGAIAARAATMK